MLLFYKNQSFLMTKTVKYLTLLFLLGAMIAKVNTECNNFCYNQVSTFGKCTICYNDCTDSSKSSFLSCTLASAETSQEQEISEIMCAQKCIPEDPNQLTSEPEIQKSVSSPVEVQTPLQTPEEDPVQSPEEKIIDPAEQEELQSQPQDAVSEENQNQNSNEEEVIETPAEEPLPEQPSVQSVQFVEEPIEQEKPIEGTEEPVVGTVEQVEVNKENPDEQAITYEELKKLKKETEGWTPPEENIFAIFCILFGSSLLFITAFTLLWKCLDKRRKLLELQKKHNKEWVKCFQKVQTSDTTIGSLESSRETQNIPTQVTEPVESLE